MPRGQHAGRRGGCRPRLLEVLRAEAPIDAIIQAAGRCDREGRLDGSGRVVVFTPPDPASPLGVYRSGRDIARVLRELPGFDLNDPGTVQRYFQLLFGTAMDTDLYETDVAAIIAFPANNLIDTNTLFEGSTILVPGGRLQSR